jgi:hypothetical protein
MERAGVIEVWMILGFKIDKALRIQNRREIPPLF